MMQKLIIIVEGSKNLFCSSKFAWLCERIYSKSVNNLATRTHEKVSQPWAWGTEEAVWSWVVWLVLVALDLTVRAGQRVQHAR